MFSYFHTYADINVLLGILFNNKPYGILTSTCSDQPYNPSSLEWNFSVSCKGSSAFIADLVFTGRIAITLTSIWIG